MVVWIVFQSRKDLHGLHMPLYSIFRWETSDAEVVCRALDMTGGEALSYAYFGQGSGPILLDSVECDGTESSLTDCRHDGWGINDCTHSEDAGVRCGWYFEIAQKVDTVVSA